MYFSKAIVVCSLALSALASPHMLRSAHHRELAHRAAIPNAAPEPVVVPQKKKRASSSRCKVRSSSAAAPTSTSVAPSSSSAPSSTTHATTSTHAVSSSIIPPQNVESTPASSATPESTKAAQPTSSTQQQQPTTTKAATPTTTKSAAAPTTSASSGSSASDPLGILTGTHSGDGTFYGTGLGSCGITNSDTDFIVAISHIIYDAFPGYNGVNPNDNPVCGKKIKATYQGKSVEVTAVDRCVGCASWDLDFSPSAFDQLADESIGRLHGVEWEWIS